jgi:hypothetical protein
MESAADAYDPATTRFGSACAKHAMRRSASRWAVSLADPVEQAAGKMGFITVPGGAYTFNGLSIPALDGMV